MLKYRNNKDGASFPQSLNRISSNLSNVQSDLKIRLQTLENGPFYAKTIWKLVTKCLVFRYLSSRLTLFLFRQLVRKCSTHKLLTKARNVVLVFLNTHVLIKPWTVASFQIFPEAVKWLMSLPWHVDEELLQLLGILSPEAL